MHPNAARYPFAAFIEHTQRWPKARKLSEVIPKPEESRALIDVRGFQNDEANILRVSHMISETASSPELRNFQVERFVKMLRYLGTNMGALTKEFVIINDGTIAQVDPAILAAIHEAFLDDPIPNFLSVNVKAVVARAKDIQKLGHS
jgi:hypothetical protein